MGTTENILAEYDERAVRYERFVESLKSLVANLLAANGLHVHAVSGRRKDRASLQEKILDSQGQYECLADITDVAGVRIITHFADQVDEVARLIEGEFEIDWENSVDKRKMLDPDRFGYLSLHYVVSLSQPRRGLVEYRDFDGLKCEVQIRSILQHAWAEIEHDLGYKSKVAVPDPVKRQFFRLAGMLELADDEFQRLREELEHYRKSVIEAIQNPTDAAVLVDAESVLALINNSEVVKRIDNAIAEGVRAPMKGRSTSAGMHVQRLEHVGLRDIGAIEEQLREREVEVVAFAVSFMKNLHELISDGLPAGVSLANLSYLMVAEKGRPAVEEHLSVLALSGDDLQRWADRILKAYRNAFTMTPKSRGQSVRRKDRK